ncbi:MAG: hypothetical protein ACRD1W_05165 [Vicinamibacterales bacterium]
MTQRTMKKLLNTSILTLAIGVVPALAQTPAPAAPAKPVNMGDLRHHIYVMEGALARAVDYGAKQLNREILQAMPGVFMLEGEARARGVHLDGYGVFFDVRVPMMRQSMVWSLRMMLDQDDAQTQASISEIRRSLQGVTDPATRASLERLLKQLESRSQTAMPRNTGNPSASPDIVTPNMITPAPAPRSAPARDSVWAKDPNRAYTEAVTRALVDAMIDYSAPMQIGSDQWLTVAARDDEGRDSLAPPDPLEEVVTMIYRIRGSDLQEYRQGKIDRDEVRRRVQLSQF